MTTLLTDAEVRSETEALAAVLKAQRGPDFAPVWEALRATALPFLPILLRDDLPRAHRLCVEGLRILGGANLGFAYAVENHLFVLGGCETYLARHPDPELRARLDEIARERWLVANTRAFVHADRANTEGIRATARDGGHVLEGAGSFVSLSTAADLLLLLLEGEHPLALFFPLRGQPGLDFGALTFPHLLVASDTRALKCAGAWIDGRWTLTLPEEHFSAGGPFGAALLAWHLTLSVGQFLGGAAAVSERTVEFTKTFRSVDNRPLARLDGILSELGQIGLRIGAAEALLADFARRLEAVAADSATDPWAELALRAQIANAFAMEQTEEISRRCRRILGTRVFGASAGDLERLTAELLMGPLIPRTNSLLERDIGLAMLAGRLLHHG